MKITKKVLSIILAAALVLGSVAVAATAAEIVTGLEGSVLTMNITSDKDVADGKAEVKPGETITVSVAYTTNFYPGNAGVDLFVWTRGIFADDSTVEYTYGLADDYWKCTTNTPLSAGYPSDYPSSSYVGFLNTRGELVDYVGQEIDVLDNDVFYTFTFTVPEDAEIGSVVDFVAPESKVYSGSGSTRGFIRQNVGDSSTYDVVASTYCETVNVDSLQITVVDETTTPDVPVEPEIVYGLEGSVLTFDVTSDKDVADGKAEVKPGETITVDVALTTNFYPGNAGVDLFVWTRGIFADDSTVAYTYGLADDYWKCTTNTPLSAGYPSDYPSSSYVGFLNTRGELVDYVGQEIRLLNKDVFYTFTFTVPEDAEIGSVVDFVIPESKVYSGSGSTRGFIRQNVGDSSTYDVVASTYCETVNVDSLQITIVGDEPTTDEPTTEEPTTEPVVEYADLTALQAAIAKAADADTTDCTEDSVAEFEAALAAANALNVEGTLASEQDAINAAAARLEAAITGLTKNEYCDYEALEAAKDAYEVISSKLSTYTTSTRDAASKAYSAALNVEAGMLKSDANQAIIDNAATALDAAVKALEKKADMTALQAAVDAEPTVAEEYATVDSWTTYAQAKAEAEDILANADDTGVSAQTAVDAAAQALTAANAALVEADADYTAVDEAKDKIPADLSIYTSDSVKALEDAVAAVEEGVKKSEQAKVDAMAQAIEDAITNLVPLGTCDYTALEYAIAAYDALVKADYKPASWTASGVDAAYEAANAVEKNMIADEAGVNQAAINDAADALTAAIVLLEEKADKSALETAIARASALVEDTYTPDSWTAADLANVLEEANVVLANADASADDVANAVAAIEAAEAKLVVKADKAALADAIAAANELNEADYTPASWAAADLVNVLEAATEVYNDDNASAEEIAAQVAALNAAMAKLAVKADKTKLDEVIVESSILDVNNTTADSFNAYYDAHEAAIAVQKNENATQEEVDKAEADLRAAIDGLVWLGQCDYSKLDAALEAAAALVEADYTISSWAAANVAAAVEAAEAVAKDLINDEAGVNQATIDEAEEAINEAIAKLELKADMTDLEAALAEEAKVAEEYATVDSWTAYAQAKAEAEDILANADDTGVSAQTAVDAAAQALNTANAALVEADADYTAVDEAKALAAQQDLSDKTQASVKALEKALAAVVEGLGKSKQAEVDAMAQAINDAIAGLEVSEAAITNLVVDLSDYTQKESREYTFTVTGEATKIRIINSKGSTSTYDRYHRNVTIVSYDAEGNVVDYLTTAPAYEEWTVTLSLGEGTYQALAKYRNTWEAFTYEFEVDIIDPAENQVTFVAKVDGSESEAGKAVSLQKGSVVCFTVVAPSSAVKAQLEYSYGSTSTYTADNATVVDNGDGTSTWTIYRALTRVGTYSIALNLKDGSGWYDAVTEDIAVEVTK